MLGLTILVLAVFWLGVVMPLIDWHGERAEALVQKAALVQRMEALVATRASPAGTGQGGRGRRGGREGAARGRQRIGGECGAAGTAAGDVHAGRGAAEQRRDAAGRRDRRLPADPAAGLVHRIVVVLMALLEEFEIARPALLIDELSVQPALHRISTAPDTFDVCVDFWISRGAGQSSRQMNRPLPATASAAA